jgi:hypothetical protein
MIQEGVPAELLSPGTELVQLAQMDEYDRYYEILGDDGDLKLTDGQKEDFRIAAHTAEPRCEERAEVRVRPRGGG